MSVGIGKGVDSLTSKGRSKFSATCRAMLAVNLESLSGLVPLLHNPSPYLLSQVGSFALGRHRDLRPAPKSRFTELLESELFWTFHLARPRWVTYRPALYGKKLPWSYRPTATGLTPARPGDHVGPVARLFERRSRKSSYSRRHGWSESTSVQTRDPPCFAER